MLPTLKKLSTKETKILIKKLEKQFSIEKLKLDYLFLKNNEDRIYMINKSFKSFDKKNLRINTLGLYFAKLEHGFPRLTIEGSQIIGKKAKSNIFELDNDNMKMWVNGKDIETKERYNNYILIKYNEDFLGVGYYKNGKILNTVPKERRIKSI